jgi:purine-binding chemotaxis protein CheW
MTAELALASDAPTLADALAIDDGVSAPPDPSADAAAGAKGSGVTRYVLFTIAETGYAVPEALVTELDRVPKVTLVPQVPVWVRGVANLRGDVISVIDLRAFLGLEASPIFRERMLVVRLLDQDFTTALVVDNVDRIVAIADEDIRPTEAAIEGSLSAFLTGVAMAGDRLVAVLDLDRLLRSRDIRQFDDIDSGAEATGLDKEDSSCEAH